MLTIAAIVVFLAVLIPCIDYVTRRPPKDEVVVVVGAGLAGLTAARALIDQGHTVVVLEALNRTGATSKPNGRRGGVCTNVCWVAT